MKQTNYLLLLMFSLTVSASQAQILKNGSFEESPIDPYLFTELYHTDKSIDHWIVGSGSGIDYIAELWIASDGKRSIDLNALGTGSIFQYIETKVGEKYTVYFDMAGNPAQMAVKMMRVSAGDDDSTYQFDITGASHSNMKWESHSFSFTATETKTTLLFQSLVTSAAGPALDNVRMEEYVDCNGVLNGTAILDECGVCLEPDDPQFNESCKDCLGKVNGTAILDECGVCLQPNNPTFNESCKDCQGKVNGNAVVDDCGVCIEANSPKFNTSCNLNIYIPTAFTPNSDNLNSRFALVKSDELNVKVATYSIYNRWGELIYSAKSFEFSNAAMWWDGTYKGQLVNQGVYMYLISVEYSNGKRETFSGNVTRM